MGSEGLRGCDGFTKHGGVFAFRRNFVGRVSWAEKLGQGTPRPPQGRPRPPHANLGPGMATMHRTRLPESPELTRTDQNRPEQTRTD